VRHPQKAPSALPRMGRTKPNRPSSGHARNPTTKSHALSPRADRSSPKNWRRLGGRAVAPLGAGPLRWSPLWTMRREHRACVEGPGRFTRWSLPSECSFAEAQPWPSHSEPHALTKRSELTLFSPAN